MSVFKIFFKSDTEIESKFDDYLKETNKSFFVLHNNKTIDNFNSFRISINKCIKLIEKLKKRGNNVSDKVRLIYDVAIQVLWINGYESIQWRETIDKINVLLYEYNLGYIKATKSKE